jgi:(2Fe-2S) ferredoxin
MAVWMEKNEVINQSAGGILGVHAGQHFYGLVSKETKYEVVTTTLEGEKAITERILHREPMNVLGRITRVYVLREIPKAP